MFYPQTSCKKSYIANGLIQLIFQDETCNVAFMPGNTCYTVNCYSEPLCESIPATPSHLSQGIVQISHIIRGGGKGDDVDEFRKKNGVNRNSRKYMHVIPW